MKLIVVEDEKIIRTGLLKHVPWQRLGVSEVEAAANGEEALAKTENFRPDIVLSDIRMPGMSGVDLCRKLREKFPEIEIIFSTGYADKEYLKAAIHCHPSLHSAVHLSILPFSFYYFSANTLISHFQYIWMHRLQV